MEAILLVEDEADLRDSLAELLSIRGHQVIAVTNGREALDQLEAGLSPCLIILDLMLPVMSGWEFRRQQLSDRKWSSIPTLLLSGVQNLASESQRLQAVAFVSKPINFSSFYNTIERFC